MKSTTTQLKYNITIHHDQEWKKYIPLIFADLSHFVDLKYQTTDNGSSWRHQFDIITNYERRQKSFMIVTWRWKTYFQRNVEEIFYTIANVILFLQLYQWKVLWKLGAKFTNARIYEVLVYRFIKNISILTFKVSIHVDENDPMRLLESDCNKRLRILLLINFISNCFQKICLLQLCF